MDQMPPQPFSICVLPRQGSVVCVRITGAVDLATGPELERVLEREVEAGSHVVLDLAGVWFIDSVGLQVIAAAAHKAQSRGSELALQSPLPAQARRVIEITGLQSLLAAE
jgi:anti-sigma B factor antagonist